MILTPGLWAMMPGCTIVLVILWIIFGKDKKTIPTITTRPPEGLDPLEMEFAQIATISDRGIYAELLYWVSMGALEIKNDGDRIGMQRIAELPSGAPEHAVFLFEGLFRKSDIVWLDQFPPEIADHKDKLLDRVGDRFKGKNPVVQDDSMAVTMGAMTLLIIVVIVLEIMIGVGVHGPILLGVALFLALVFLQNGALGFRSKHNRFELIVGVGGTVLVLVLHLILLKLHVDQPLFLILFAVCFLICIPCILFMERRVNHRVYGQILGFREFIKTAEWDRLKQLSEEDPNYGMDILPYAMLFNLGTRWTAQFENKTIYTCVEKMEDTLSETTK